VVRMKKGRSMKLGMRNSNDSSGQLFVNLSSNGGAGGAVGMDIWTPRDGEFAMATNSSRSPSVCGSQLQRELLSTPRSPFDSGSVGGGTRRLHSFSKTRGSQDHDVFSGSTNLDAWLLDVLEQGAPPPLASSGNLSEDILALDCLMDCSDMNNSSAAAIAPSAAATVPPSAACSHVKVEVKEEYLQLDEARQKVRDNSNTNSCANMSSATSTQTQQPMQPVQPLQHQYMVYNPQTSPASGYQSNSMPPPAHYPSGQSSYIHASPPQHHANHQTVYMAPPGAVLQVPVGYAHQHPGMIPISAGSHGSYLPMNSPAIVAMPMAPAYASHYTAGYIQSTDARSLAGSSTRSVSLSTPASYGYGAGGGSRSIPDGRRETALSSVDSSCDSQGQKGKKKRYKRTTASKFCHICLRKETAVQLAVCGNINSGTCLKVVCEICFTKFGWDWEQATSINSDWTCTHCRNECPDSARCRIYEKVNNKREPMHQRKKTPVLRRFAEIPLLPSFK